MKWISHFLLAAVLLLSLCACGRGGSQEQYDPGGPAWQEQYDLGVRYLSEGNYEEAILAFTAAIEIDPNRAEAYTGRSDAYVLSGETAEHLAAAQGDYEKAIELDETNADAYLGLADVYIRLGDYDKALEVLRQGLDKTGSQDIADKIAEIESGNIADSSGNVRRMTGYDSEGDLVYWWDYTYNEWGKQSAITAYDENGARMGHIDMLYDEVGNQLRSFTYNPHSGEISVIEYTYDDNGNRVTSTRYTTEGNVDEYCEYAYEGNLCVRQTDYSADGERKGSWVIEYEGEKRTKRFYYRADDTLSYYQTWEYNDQGEVAVYSSFDADGTLQWKHINRYDTNGQYIGEDLYDGQGNLTGSTVNN